MSLLQDLRFALRLMIKDRWFSAVAITALALGIGVNATVFTMYLAATTSCSFESTSSDPNRPWNR